MDSYLATFRQSLFSLGIMRGQKKGWGAVKIGMKLDTTEEAGTTLAAAVLGAKQANDVTKRTIEVAKKVEEAHVDRESFWVRPPPRCIYMLETVLYSDENVAHRRLVGISGE